jgi:hypothetical protein
MTLAESATVAAIGGAAVSPPVPAGTGDPAPAPAPPAGDTDRPAVATAATAAVADASAAPPAPRHASRPIPAPAEGLEEAAGGRRVRTPLLALVALVALALVVLAVGAWLLVPAATIAVTPKREPISVNLSVSADPAATSIDPSTATIPAVTVDIPVQVSQTFTTTGVHVEQTTATGSVTFTNYDPTSSNTISSGSIVSTEGGIRFRTLASVTVPKASFTPPSTTVPSSRSVGIEAVRPGTSGNVPANAIRVVPAGESPLFLQVSNPQPTSGGSRTETPVVTTTEVAKAVAELQAKVETQFHAAVAAGEGAPEGSTVFPETAVLGASTPAPDPKTLVGQAVSSYDLSLSASGSVIAVDPTPVRQIAEQQLMTKVGADHRLVDGSTQVEVGDGTVGEDGSVSFPAHATADRVLVVDATQLRALVKGKTRAEALAALAPFGSATVSLWPDWVTTVTAIDGRLALTVDQSGNAGQPGASGSPTGSLRPAATSTNRPSGSVRPSPSARPGDPGTPAASGDAGSGAP